MTNLTQLEALARAATPGPWDNNRGRNIGARKENVLIVAGSYNAPSAANAAYIAAANPAAILALIERVRVAEAGMGHVLIAEEPYTTTTPSLGDYTR